MAKVIYCKDGAFPDWSAVVRGETEEEVFQKAAEHGKSVDKLELTPEMARQVKALIKEE